MYVVDFKKNMYIYLVLRPITKNSYQLDEAFHSFDTAYTYLQMYGNTRCIILKLKLKEVIQ